MNNEHISKTEGKKFSFRKIFNKRNLAKGAAAVIIVGGAYMAGVEKGDILEDAVNCPEGLTRQELLSTKTINHQEIKTEDETVETGEVLCSSFSFEKDGHNVDVLATVPLSDYEARYFLKEEKVKEKSTFNKIWERLPFNKRLVSPVPEDKGEN